MGFFYAMNFKTKTRIEGNQVVIDLYHDDHYLTEYYFFLDDVDHFIDHIKRKTWGTVQNINEIKLAICKTQDKY
jgi:hypothetical protein